MPKKGGKKVVKKVDDEPILHFGEGSFTHPNGDMYTGEYCAHRCGLIWKEGKGIYTTEDNQIYEGYWKDDKLIEKVPLSIKYPTGEVFHGSVAQDKYYGQGIYTMDNSMNISCEFLNNKPTGNITLTDINGHFWEGVAGNNEALLLPDNQFYHALSEKHGIGKLKSKTQEKELENITLDGENKDAISDRELEKKIFSKSKKTPDEYDFAESKWFQRYLRYRTMKDTITEKLKNLKSDKESESLTDEERKWYKKYQKHKLMNVKKTNTEASASDTKLLDAFYSNEFKESSPPLKVFYPSNDWKDEIVKD